VHYLSSLSEGTRAALSSGLLMLGFGIHIANALPSQLTADAYARAERFLPWNEDHTMINGHIQPHWIGTEDRFWYLRTAGNNKKEFVVVDAATGQRGPAFDQTRIADELSRATNAKIDATALPFTEFRYTRSKTAIQFQLADKVWTCGLKAGGCAGELPPGRPNEVLSPDGKWAASVRAYNLWVRSTESDTEFALTADGIEHYGYAGSPGDSTHAISDVRLHAPAPPMVIWSPDSRHILTHRLDERQVKNLYLIQSAPEDGSFRAKLYTYKFSYPGDEHVAQLEPMVFDVGTRKQVSLATPPMIGVAASLVEADYTWWSADGTKIYYLNRDRFSKSVSLNVADPSSGRVSELLKESSKTRVMTGDGVLDDDDPLVKVLHNGDMIWYSERDGWGHLYYYGASGKLRNQITRGEWVVRGIVRVDEQADRIYFTASGREAGDPYNQHLYSINMDGSGLTLLTPEDAEHLVHRHLSPLGTGDFETNNLANDAEKNAFSSSGKYFVYSYSRPDMPPVLALRTAKGRLVKELERADISTLTQGGYTPVEPFQVLAADGVTPIYGNLFRPSTFDPSRKYPVIDSIYPGPQSIQTRKDFTTGSEPQALAELGFIVITVDGRGTPHRSKEFKNHSYGHLAKASDLEDHIAGIRQLARRYPYMDLERVGIEGYSAGGCAAAHALLTYPEFYKVAVSASGDHDLRSNLSFWAETNNGPLAEGDYEGASNLPLAANLKGKLLLMHGDMDDNVPPTLTLMLVNALIKANKDFDLLIVPNENHDMYRTSPYVIRRKWDYFVRNLMGAEPPAGYEIKGAQGPWVLPFP